MQFTGGRKHLLRTGIALGALVAFGQAAPAFAQDAAEQSREVQTYSFDIPAQELGSALRAFARASRQQVTFDDSAVRGKRSPALNGTYTAEQALDVLLRGSGLAARRGSSGLFIVRPAAQVSPAAGETGSLSGEAATPEGEVIVVTGTNIRGAMNLSNGVQKGPPIGVGPLGRTGKHSWIDRLAGLLEKSPWQDTDPIALSSSVRSHRSF